VPHGAGGAFAAGADIQDSVIAAFIEKRPCS
jgi:hypothetical protein